MSEKYIKTEVTYLARTELAVRIGFGDEAAWIPRALLSWSCDQEVDKLRHNNDFQIELLEWKANELGLIY